MNHKWNKENVCVNCGLHRMMQSWRLHMATVNHPPWDIYKYGRSWYYGYPNSDKKEYIKGIGFKRPDCKKEK